MGGCVRGCSPKRVFVQYRDSARRTVRLFASRACAHSFGRWPAYCQFAEQAYCGPCGRAHANGQCIFWIFDRRASSFGCVVTSSGDVANFVATGEKRAHPWSAVSQQHGAKPTQKKEPGLPDSIGRPDLRLRRKPREGPLFLGPLGSGMFTSSLASSLQMGRVEASTCDQRCEK